MTQKIFAIIAVLLLFLAAFALLLPRLARRYAKEEVHRYHDGLLNRHYQEVEAMYSQMHLWRHDYRNHIQLMKVYLAGKDYERLGHYLDELDADLTAVDTFLRTGNVMIDAILNSKISLAKSKEIPVNAKAIVPKEFACSDLELCSVIGNLMDNAIEACEKIPDPEDRFLRVYMDVLKGKFYLCITNSTNGASPGADGHFPTSKKHSEHGFGLLRVDEIVSRYGGFVNRQQEEGVFSTEVVLPLS